MHMLTYAIRKQAIMLCYLIANNYIICIQTSGEEK